MIEKQYHFSAIIGLARLASTLVRISNKHLSKVVVEYKGITVELDYTLESIMDVMSLDIRPGDLFHIRFVGIDEVQALQLIEDQFGRMNL
ncbi:HPr family phosphocarrier protein [Niallia sp. FSL W8-0951]|uniref:HPr family phosphocarrier protein n=1 Tax=Niallia sp. FSL W8-0951 TaxID=2954639 RepID=UPI0030F8BF95